MEYLLFNIMTILYDAFSYLNLSNFFREFLGVHDYVISDILVSDFFAYLIYFAAIIFVFVFILRLFVGLLIKFWRLFTE